MSMTDLLAAVFGEHYVQAQPCVDMHVEHTCSVISCGQTIPPMHRHYVVMTCDVIGVATIETVAVQCVDCVEDSNDADMVIDED